MPDRDDQWRYSDRVPQDRRARLADPGTYEELTRRVVLDMREIRAYALPGRDRGLTDCVQPIFTFELLNVGDALFNGPFGYRAQYWLGAPRGIAANRELISALASKLLGSVDTDAAPNLAKIDVCSSLAAASAKLWIRESSSLIDAPPDLEVKRWADEAAKGVELARLGLQAPVATKFEVKGALLDPYGNEVVPVTKIRRHIDIHHYGFS